MIFRFDIGASMRKAQAECKITNRQIAKELGVCEMSVQRWRNSHDAKLSRVVTLAELFDMDVEQFIKLGA